MVKKTLKALSKEFLMECTLVTLIYMFNLTRNHLTLSWEICVLNLFINMVAISSVTIVFQNKSRDYLTECGMKLFCYLGRVKPLLLTKNHCLTKWPSPLVTYPCVTQIHPRTWPDFRTQGDRSFLQTTRTPVLPLVSMRFFLQFV